MTSKNAYGHLVIAKIVYLKPHTIYLSIKKRLCIKLKWSKLTGKADILSVNDCAKVSFSFSIAHRMGFLGEDRKILQDVYKGIDMDGGSI